MAHIWHTGTSTLAPPTSGSAHFVVGNWLPGVESHHHGRLQRTLDCCYPTRQVAEYFEFFVSNQNFVRLMEREALSGGPKPEGFSPRSNVVSEATAAISEELGLDPSQGAEAAHLVLSIMGLCWFPTVHAGTVLPALGFDPRSPEFHEQRKRHVVELVLRGVQGNIPLTNLSNS